MPRIPILILFFAFIVGSFGLEAKTVRVKGYRRKDGTYVKPHIRSSPDKHKWNNFGSARSAGSAYSGGDTSPDLRDSDRDGIANRYDTDDDNDGIHDDLE